MSSEPDKIMQTLDEAEPKADSSPTPVLLIGLFALLFFWGLTFVDNHGGGFNPQVYGPYESYQMVDDLQVKDPAAEARALGMAKFNAVCASCHQASGSGSPAVGAPPLAGSDWVNAAGPNRIIRIVMNGLTGPVDVSGGHYGTGTMTPFKDVFSDQEVASILTYVRSQWGNKGDLVTPEEVAAIRKQVNSRPNNWTAPELQKIPEKN